MARFSRDDPRRGQPLAEHSARVSEFCGAEGKPAGAERLCALAGLLHDFGKAGDAWQAYLRADGSRSSGKLNHSAAGARWLTERYRDRTGFTEAMTKEILALAICGHHSGLPDVVSPADNVEMLSRRLCPESGLPSRETVNECAEKFFSECATEESADALFDKAVAEVERLTRIAMETERETRLSARPEEKNKGVGVGYLFCSLLARFVESCLIDADRYDAYLFDSRQQPEAETSPDALWKTLGRRLETRLARFSQEAATGASAEGESGRRRVAVTKLRGEIAGACLAFGEREPGVYRLCVPTGGGKTLSSLRFALRHAEKNGMKRIFYVIPYTTIIDQTEEEFSEALGGAEGDGRLILVHHAAVEREPDGDERPAAGWALSTERWSSPLVLTTMVQFLNTLFDGRNSCVRRMRALAGSVLIFDEVQALPIKCTSLFTAACMFLTRVCGATVVLCSATQPRLETLRVPVVFSERPDMVADFEEKFRQMKRTRVVDERRRALDSAEALASYTLEKLESCRSALVVLNTKAAARGLYAALKTRMPQGWALLHLSAAMCQTHRRKVLKQLRETLENGEPVLCVTTQVIEAGVDISAECVIRSWAGLDSLAQAAGRCNRHGESACRDVYLIRYGGENLDRLCDIQTGQRVCADTLAEAARLGRDCLAPATVGRYYELFYRDTKVKGKLDYMVEVSEGISASIFELLSFNIAEARNAPKDRGLSWPLLAAFETAGRSFEAIDGAGDTALVPYDDEAKRLIERLSAPELSPREAAALLRKAQQYAVSLYEHTREKLESRSALYPLSCGAYALKENFYDGEIGVDEDGKLDFCEA